MGYRTDSCALAATLYHKIYKGNFLNIIDNYKKFLFTIMIYVIFTPIIYSQDDSTKLHDKTFVLIPSLHSIQIDATSIILMNQIGGEIDLDIFHSEYKNTCLGTRFGIEHYYLINFVDKYYGSPFTNYNLFARLSTTPKDLSISILLGMTYYTSEEPSYIPSKYLFRTGFEIKYGTTLGFLIKGSTSMIKNSSFVGIGVYFGYNHN